MTNEEFRQYWRPARDSFGKWKGHSADGKHPSYFLAKALGVDYPELGYWGQIELTDELKNILLLLVGPHRETMLKIYQIRRKHDEQKRRAYKQKRRADLRQIKQDNSDAEREAGVDPS